jgi:hypothetical protein
MRSEGITGHRIGQWDTIVQTLDALSFWNGSEATNENEAGAFAYKICNEGEASDT